MTQWNIQEHSLEVMADMTVQIGKMNLFIHTLSKQETIIIAVILMVVLMVHGVTPPIQTQNGIYVQLTNARQVPMNSPLLN